MNQLAAKYGCAIYAAVILVGGALVVMLTSCTTDNGYQRTPSSENRARGARRRNHG